MLAIANPKAFAAIGAVYSGVEVREETDRVNHHKKKIALLFSAMRLFAERLRKKGWRVEYVKLTDGCNTGSSSS